MNALLNSMDGWVGGRGEEGGLNELLLDSMGGLGRGKEGGWNELLDSMERWVGGTYQ